MKNKNTGIHTCDICDKHIKKWEQTLIKKIHYTPGKNFKKCSSDIKTHTEILIELCPDCLTYLEKLIKQEIDLNV